MTTTELSQDEGQRARPAPPSPVHDIVTGGIEGAVGYTAIEPLIGKLTHEAGEVVKNPFRAGVGKRLAIAGGVGAASTGLIGALVSLTSKKAKERKQEMSDPVKGLIEFAETLDQKIPRAKSKQRHLVTTAGLGALAAGAALVPSARRLIGIKVRGVGAKNLGIEAARHNQGGKMVSDYIEAAQLGLNTGIKGKVMGKVIQGALAHPEGKIAGAFKAFPGQYGSGDIGQRLATEHYARFRSSPKAALDFWDYEHSLLHGGKHAERIANLEKNGLDTSRVEVRRKKQLDEMHYGREAANNAIKEQVEVHGKSEMEAIKHVAYNHNDPKVQHYFNELAMTKTAAVDQYAKKALIAPGLLAGGAGAVVYGRKRNQTPAQAVKSTVRFETLHPGMIELDSYDYTSNGSLRSGVRLDKYEKTIHAREIDRHISDYIKASAIGAVAGAAIPTSGSLAKRSLIGAGGGTLLAGALHVAGRKDPYGEQSEDAKRLQRTAPKIAGGAAILGGLLARYRNRNAGALKVLKPRL